MAEHFARVYHIKGFSQPRDEHLHLHLLSPSTRFPYLVASSSSTKGKCTTRHVGMLLKLFFCASIGVTLGVNLYHVSFKFTSATVASAADGAITSFLAVLLRLIIT